MIMLSYFHTSNNIWSTFSISLPEKIQTYPRLGCLKSNLTAKCAKFFVKYAKSKTLKLWSLRPLRKVSAASAVKIFIFLIQPLHCLGFKAKDQDFNNGKNKNQYHRSRYFRAVSRMLPADEWLWNGNFWTTFQTRWSLYELGKRRLYFRWMYTMASWIKWEQSFLPVVVWTDRYAIREIYKPWSKDGHWIEK